MKSTTNEKIQKPAANEIQTFLSERSGWALDQNRLAKEYSFPSFSRAVVFVNKIVNPIEENQNYPKITLSYNRVFVSLQTTEVGAITFLDLEMAKEFDRLFGEKKTGVSETKK